MEFCRELARQLPAQQGRRDKAGDDSERRHDGDQPDRYFAAARMARDFGCAATQLCDFKGHLPSEKKRYTEKS
jgi:hypothetical protein